MESTKRIEVAPQQIEEVMSMGDALKREVELGRIAQIQHENREAEETHRMRIKYARNIFAVVCSWLTCVVLSVVCSGIQYLNFTLPDSVLIAFITTTTINVLGLLYVVTRWLFPSSFRQEGRRKSD